MPRGKGVCSYCWGDDDCVCFTALCVFRRSGEGVVKVLFFDEVVDEGCLAAVVADDYRFIRGVVFSGVHGYLCFCGGKPR